MNLYLADREQVKDALSASIGGHSDLKPEQDALPSSQLRDSAGFTPNFPRFLQRLFPVGTDRTHYITEVANPAVNLSYGNLT